MPLLGFPATSTIEFNHANNKPLPQSNTGAVAVLLPAMHTVGLNEDFKYWMEKDGCTAEYLWIPMCLLCFWLSLHCLFHACLVRGGGLQ